MITSYHKQTKNARGAIKAVKKKYQSTIDATRRYDERIYSLIAIRLRKDEDADIIASWEEAHESGIKNREWLREMFEALKREKS